MMGILNIENLGFKCEEFLHLMPSKSKNFQIMDLDVEQIVNFRAYFLETTRVMLLPVAAYAFVDYLPARISFLSKLDLRVDNGHRGKIFLQFKCCQNF